MEAKLEYCGNKIEIVNFSHSIEDEKMGNPYNCSFDIRVVSGLFSGFADGCECDYKEFKMFIDGLSDLIYFRRDEVTFQEIGYGGTIVFRGDGCGHITVSGTVYGTAMIHSLTFEFETDQTVYSSFISELGCLQ